MIEALAGVSTEEVASGPAAAGAAHPRPPVPSVVSRTPLPGPAGALQIVFEAV
ncbi:hypothetical protein [Streptomyces glomeratus]|uniref:hypothetical protein n=1 Tax=Streptomyces glomeratus TaxID=284452 RepID=UPI001F24BD17|nr:hypothetical protein [Streptomyces glomeratus]MCF1508980.1 hypothetical protein [Streptomyces glomeratus]